ncbi:CPBP family intramembrane glutamic endopeptidase [Roseovarius aquimarinus]|uniref:CPBP family intramembrane glutamic endopeptidase n=1 Tax=Roseovarius aquimarinus TaxID=1229156 RepID=A0ABW7I9F4_9RHOB
MRYPLHARLVDPARPSASPWRLLLGVVLVIVLFLALSVGYGWLCTQFLPPETWGPDGTGIETASTPGGALVNLFAFGLLILALAVVLPLLHKRGIGTLIGPRRLALRQSGRVAAFVVAVLVLGSLVQLFDPIEMLPGLPAGLWLGLLPLTVLGLLIQTGAEELLFRGYLQSQLAARFRHPAVWMVLPSVLFGMLHFQPGLMGDAAWIIVLWAMLFGIAAADLTARCGTLGPAITLHFINNFGAIAIASTSGYFDGLALATYPFGPEDTALMLRWMPMDLALLFCSYLAARLALRV